MIPLVIWLEIEEEGIITQLYETYADCDTIDFSTKRLGYRSSRAIKGKKRQSWYSTFEAFNINIKDMRNDSFNKLYSILNSQTGYIVILIDNSFYRVSYESDTISQTKKWNDFHEEYLHTIQLTLEEDFAPVEVV